MTIDLTYPIHQGMFKYPSDPEVEIKKVEARAEDDCGGWSEGDNHPLFGGITKYKSGYTETSRRSHHGTHVDAPSHKFPDGRTIDNYAICKFINKALLVDLTATDLLMREKREINREDVKDYLKAGASAHVQDIGALIFYTGFCDEIARNEGKLHAEAKLAFEETFPYFNQGAMSDIIAFYKGLNIIGIDSFSLDPRGSNSEVHRILLGKDVLPLETLANLGSLKNHAKNSVFMLYSVPLNCTGADAAPARAYAVVNSA